MSATEPGFLAGETFGGYLVSLVYFVGLRRATAARRASACAGCVSSTCPGRTSDSVALVKRTVPLFQWFALPGQTNATLEMSVSGRRVDVPGLKSLFHRFADNAVGTPPPATKK